MPRLLRSKKDRILLLQSTNGKCKNCGADLSDGWEADHVIPWKLTRRTNVHEMQPLCSKCNRQKGDKHGDPA